MVQYINGTDQRSTPPNYDLLCVKLDYQIQNKDYVFLINSHILWLIVYICIYCIKAKLIGHILRWLMYALIAR